jgi:Protein of unknown function (DUF1588)/Protein of unknown function (DUF1592)/Protein of unknown function (DUF1585)/Protein of unknown function (DUF1587)
MQRIGMSVIRMVPAISCFALLFSACSGSTTGNAGSGGTQGNSTGGTNRPTPPDPGADQIVSSSLARRLSQAEIDATLEDILGDTSRPATRLLNEDEFKPYDNDYPIQKGSQAFTDAMRELSREVASRAVGNAATRDKFMPCQPSGPGDSVCFKTAVQALGLRFLRRPLSADEQTPYLKLLAFATEKVPTVATDFWTSIGLLLRAFIQDPEFLHRVEIGRATATAGVFALDSYEIASRLSYLLWGSTPDASLLQSAAKDELITEAGRSAAFNRMMKQPRGRSQISRFHSMWLGYRTIPHPADVTARFAAETSKLLETVIFDEPSSYFDIFTSKRTYLTTAGAKHYSLPEPAGAEGWVDYGNSGRAGLLSHGAVLAAFSKFSDTSPTQRGIFVRTRLLCEAIQPPPATVDADQPPGNPDAECKTARYMAHMDQSGCKSCHSQMDPIGFGLENYDIAGRYRETDNGKPQCKIPGQGEVVGIGTFSGPKALAESLLASGQLQDCMVKQLLTFALGRELVDDEEPVASKLRATMKSNGDSFVSLLRTLTTDASFALRRVPGVKP